MGDDSLFLFEQNVDDLEGFFVGSAVVVAAEAEEAQQRLARWCAAARIPSPVSERTEAYLLCRAEYVLSKVGMSKARLVHDGVMCVSLGFRDVEDEDFLLYGSAQHGAAPLGPAGLDVFLVEQDVDHLANVEGFGQDDVTSAAVVVAPSEAEALLAVRAWYEEESLPAPVGVLHVFRLGSAVEIPTGGLGRMRPTVATHGVLCANVGVPPRARAHPRPRGGPGRRR
jgi:hypothetical protein